jgi:ribonuclease D
LLQLLRDPELLFVGRKIEQDLKYLDADYGCNLVDVTRWKDLKDIANSKPSVIDRNWSLQDLAATFVGVKLSKGDTRTSNWELPGLSIDQIKYAAADVGIAVEIYARLCPPLLSTDPAGVAGAAQRA